MTTDPLTGDEALDHSLTVLAYWCPVDAPQPELEAWWAEVRRVIEERATQAVMDAKAQDGFDA